MIIGITGTLGSGKGAVAEYLVEKGFKHYSARAVISEEVERRGLPVNRDTLTEVANDIRRSDPAYPQTHMYAKAVADGTENAIFESVREIAGAQLLKSHGAVIIAVDADPKIRYERAVRRKSATDNVDFETFIQQEEREMSSDDPAKQNIRGVAALADYHVTNSGSLEELHTKIDVILERTPTRFDGSR